MRLWFLMAREELEPENNPWKDEYDCTYGFVIRAENEDHARSIANANGGFEVCGKSVTPRSKKCDPWLYEEYSSCEELLPDGADGVILEDYHAG